MSFPTPPVPPPGSPPPPSSGPAPAPRRGRDRFGRWVALGVAAAVLWVAGCLTGLVLLHPGTTTGLPAAAVPSGSATDAPSGTPAPPAAALATATSPAAPPPAATTAPRVTTPAPVRSAAPALSLCGAPPNPYGFNFCGRGHLIYASQLPDGICGYFACIGNFFNGTGYLVECRDGQYSMSGGKQGACSYHQGVRRAVYSG